MEGLAPLHDSAMTKRPTVATIVAGAVVFAMPCASAPSPKEMPAARPTTRPPVAVVPLTPATLEAEHGLRETEVTKQLSRAKDRLARAAARLRNLDDETAADRARRIAVDTKTRLARAELSAAALVSVVEEARGTVIVVPSLGLFASDEPRLLPGAGAHLGPIAEALSQDERHRIVVEDHTTGRASDQSNPELSQARAEAVRDFLVEHGVRAVLLSAIGTGVQPTDATVAAQGRQAREVEIVVEPAPRH